MLTLSSESSDQRPEWCLFSRGISKQNRPDCMAPTAAIVFSGMCPPQCIHNSLLLSLRSNIGTSLPNVTDSTQELVPKQSLPGNSLLWKTASILKVRSHLGSGCRRLPHSSSHINTCIHPLREAAGSWLALIGTNFHPVPGTAIC